MSLGWYAIRSKPNKEDFVWGQLKSQAVEVFYPRLKVNPVNPRAKKVKPYFPGYLFIRADLDESGYSKFQWLPHSLGLVMFGGEPASVPDNLIQAIRVRVNDIAEAGGLTLDGLNTGDRIRIQSGPFAGFDAIFDERLPGSERVKVLLAFVSDRQVSVELKVGQIEKLKNS